MFVIVGLFLFVGTIYFCRQTKKTYLDQLLRLYSKFNSVNGLYSSNNVRLSGINIGTVEDIEFLNDSSVIKMVIKMKFVNTSRKMLWQASIRMV
jgi:phospholipid/cholesterol/gamma-HCH transport system substrate-binding protein